MNPPEHNTRLPDAHVFLEGKEGIKPHQYAGESLRAFVAGFEDVPLVTKAAHTLVEAQAIMNRPGWLEAHDAAHRAITQAFKRVTDNPAPELAREAGTIESIYKSQALNAGTLDMVKHPELLSLLAPLKTYLAEFQGFLRSWTGLQPGRMRPKEDDAISPAKHRENLETMRPGGLERKPATLLADCGDANCTIDHAAAGWKSSFPQKEKAAKGKCRPVFLGAACAVSIGALALHHYGKSGTSSQAPTADERESAKTSEQRAEDVAYVINHAVSCGLTDTFIQPPIGALVQTGAENGTLPKGLRWIKNIFESHDHHGGGACNDPAHNPTAHSHAGPSSFKSNAMHWFTGEIAGDAGAVPLTIFVQRHMPSFMHGLRKIMEPFAGRAFRNGAERGAREWAISEGLNPDGAEAKTRANEIYEREISRLSLAAVWNIFSVPINLAVQKLSGSKASLSVMAMGKIFGALASNGMLIGGRALTPESFGSLDSFNSRHVVLPVTKAVGKVFSIEDATVDKMAAQQQKPSKGWTGRVERDTSPTPTDRGV